MCTRMNLIVTWCQDLHQHWNYKAHDMATLTSYHIVILGSYAVNVADSLGMRMCTRGPTDESQTVIALLRLWYSPSIIVMYTFWTDHSCGRNLHEICMVDPRSYFSYEYYCSLPSRLSLSWCSVMLSPQHGKYLDAYNSLVKGVDIYHILYGRIMCSSLATIGQPNMS